MEQSIIITSRQHLFASRPEEKGMFPLCDVGALHIAEGWIGVDYPILHQISERKHVCRHLQLLQPPLAEAQSVILYYHFLYLLGGQIVKTFGSSRNLQVSRQMEILHVVRAIPVLFDNPFPRCPECLNGIALPLLHLDIGVVFDARYCLSCMNLVGVN
jgi:hypothetical protein